MSKKLIWIVVLLLIALVPVHAQGDYEPEYQPDACPMPIPAGETEGDTLDCGYLIVPEDRSDPGGQTIALAVAILHSPDALPDPLIYLAGGPGGSALTEADAWTNSPFRAERDIILIDQRGTGYSEPTLDCDEYADTYAHRDADIDTRACWTRVSTFRPTTAARTPPTSPICVWRWAWTRSISTASPTARAWR